jgi:hypothetical protein
MTCGPEERGTRENEIAWELGLLLEWRTVRSVYVMGRESVLVQFTGPASDAVGGKLGGRAAIQRTELLWCNEASDTLV